MELRMGKESMVKRMGHPQWEHHETIIGRCGKIHHSIAIYTGSFLYWKIIELNGRNITWNPNFTGCDNTYLLKTVTFQCKWSQICGAFPTKSCFLGGCSILVGISWEIPPVSGICEENYRTFQSATFDQRRVCEHINIYYLYMHIIQFNIYIYMYINTLW